MGQPIQSEDLIALAQAQLAAQFADAPNLQQVVASIATSVQEIDIVTVQLASWDDLDTAVGVALDQMGEIVNQPRPGGAYPLGVSDDVYRAFLRAAVRRNRSNGTTQDVADVLLLLLDGYISGCAVVDTGSASFGVVLYQTAMPPQLVIDAIVPYILASKPLGVELSSVIVVPPGVYIFAWDGYPDPPFRGYDAGHWAIPIYP